MSAWQAIGVPQSAILDHPISADDLPSGRYVFNAISDQALLDGESRCCVDNSYPRKLFAGLLVYQWIRNRWGGREFDERPEWFRYGIAHVIPCKSLNPNELLFVAPGQPSRFSLCVFKSVPHHPPRTDFEHPVEMVPE